MIHDIASGRMYATAEFVSLIKKIENGELVPVVHGEWISKDNGTHYFDGVWECSVCGEYSDDTVMGKPRANFCPMCGARMIVQGKNNEHK